MMKTIPLLAAAAIIGTSPLAPIESPVPLHDHGNKQIEIRTNCGKSYLGVFIYDVKGELQSERPVDADHGALIDRVVAGSPAEKAGLQASDVIVGWNGQRIDRIQQVMKLVMDTPPGRIVQLDVLRNGATMKMQATIGKRMCDDEEFTFFIPDLDSTTRSQIEAFRGRFEQLDMRWDSIGQYWDFQEMTSRFGKPKLGVELQKLTPRLAEYFGAEENAGALISNVMDNMPAQKGGLQSGDIILAIDGEKMTTADDVRNNIRNKEGWIDVKVLRDKHELVVPVDLGSALPPVSSPSNMPPNTNLDIE
jgi:S1-C subfamily serine protease